MRRFFLLAIFFNLALVVFVSPQASADFTQALNYQGRLVDANGVPLADANYSIRYDICTDSACTAVVWTVTHGAVAVADGLFSDVLEGGTPALSSVGFTAANYYLQLTVNGTTYAPTQRLTASAMSLNSDLLDGHDTSYFMIAATDNWVNTTGDTMTGALTMSGAGIAMGAQNITNSGTIEANILQDDDDASLSINDSVAVTGGLSVTTQLTSSVATGTAPFVISNSGTMSVNLNADMLDGYHASTLLAQAQSNFDPRYVNVTGDTMTGDLTLTGGSTDIILGGGTITDSMGAVLLSDTVTINNLLTLTGANGDITFDNAGGLLTLAGGNISDSAGNVNINDTVNVTGALTTTTSVAASTYITAGSYITAGTYVDAASYIEGSDLRSNTDIYCNNDGGQGNCSLYFYDNVANTDEYLRWNDASDWFEISNDLYVNGDISAASYTTLDARYVNVTGDTMTGYLNFSGTSGISMNDKPIYLRGTSGSDTNHGMLFNGTVDGPEFRGNAGYTWKTGTAGATERMKLLTTALYSYVPTFVGSSDANKMIKFTDAWSSYPDSTTGSEISNDTSAYKTLMIIGNKSYNSAFRRVSVWDRLEINGPVVSSYAYAARGIQTKIGPGTGADNQWHQVDCDAGYAITNFTVYVSGSYMDGNMTIMCQNLGNLMTSTCAWTGGSGTADNAYHQASCPANTLARGIRAYANAQIDNQLALNCCNTTSGSYTQFNNWISQGTTDNNNDDTYMGIQCPAGTYLTDLDIWASSYLDGNMLIMCGAPAP